MSVPVQDNYLAIYPFYCFGSLNLRIKCKRIFDSCVLLFSYQGSCRFDSFDILSYLFQLVKNFFKKFFQPFGWAVLFSTAILDYHIRIALSRTFLNFSSTEVAFQSFSVAHSNFYRLSYLQSLVNNFLKLFCDSRAVSGERGIWTLAPLLTTYSLSRGAPSASWVFLHSLFRIYILFFSEVTPERREWDSNPRALADKRFSRPPRYDHFDISPYPRFVSDR